MTGRGRTIGRVAVAGVPDQKALIRERAAELFATRGYHATGIEDISQAVGLGRGALYHHIKSKEQLLFDISTLGLQDLIDITEPIVGSARDPEAKLREMGRALMRNIADNRSALTVCFREVDLMTPPYRDRLVQHRLVYQRQWEAVLDEGVAAGVFSPMDPLVVMGVLGMHNYSYLWLHEGRLPPEAIADVFCDVLLGGLRAT